MSLRGNVLAPRDPRLSYLKRVPFPLSVAHAHAPASPAPRARDRLVAALVAAHRRVKKGQLSVDDSPNEAGQALRRVVPRDGTATKRTMLTRIARRRDLDPPADRGRARAHRPHAQGTHSDAGRLGQPDRPARMAQIEDGPNHLACQQARAGGLPPDLRRPPRPIQPAEAGQTTTPRPGRRRPPHPEARGRRARKNHPSCSPANTVIRARE